MPNDINMVPNVIPKLYKNAAKLTARLMRMDSKMIQTIPS